MFKIALCNFQDVKGFVPLCAWLCVVIDERAKTMLEKMASIDWMVLMSFMICMSYVTGWFIDKILDKVGFGTIGNWLIIATGAISGMYACDIYWYPLDRFPEYALVSIVGGAFVTLLFMCVLKRIFIR